MKNFKFDLNAKVAIYVPSTTDVNVPTDNKEFVNKVMTKFSEWFGGDRFTIDTGNYVITVDPKRYRIFDRAAGKPLVNGVVRIDEQDMKDILAAAPKSQRGWI